MNDDIKIAAQNEPIVDVIRNRMHSYGCEGCQTTVAEWSGEASFKRTRADRRTSVVRRGCEAFKTEGLDYVLAPLRQLSFLSASIFGKHCFFSICLFFSQKFTDELRTRSYFGV